MILLDETLLRLLALLSCYYQLSIEFCDLQILVIDGVFYGNQSSLQALDGHIFAIFRTFGLASSILAL